jgi:hypothetical protein
MVDLEDESSVEEHELTSQVHLMEHIQEDGALQH